jgi:endonuclease-3 related protein
VPAPDLHGIYQTLFAAYGPQHWWPADSPFEVMVGAILTQNAAWPNVERAIANLKRNNVLDPHSLRALPDSRLHQLLQPSGFFRVKTRRLRNYLDYFVERYDGDVTRMRKAPLPRLRSELLAVNGIGRETADSILLYALNKRIFVIDAYTRRILSRHQLAQPDDDYDDLRKMFEVNLPRSIRIYNEYHALFVRLAKTNCRVKPQCRGCPLEPLLQERDSETTGKYGLTQMKSKGKMQSAKCKSSF